MKMTCLLSKTWKYIMNNNYKSSEDITKISSYVNYVGRVNCVGRVLDMLKVNNLRKLSGYWPYSSNYMLPSQMLKSLKKILPGPGYSISEELHSNSCYSYELNFCESLTHLKTISPTLKSLTINHRVLTEDLSVCEMDEILSICPALEELRIYLCPEECLNIFSPTVTKLEVQMWHEDIHTMYISAPYARELKIRGDVRKTDFVLRDIKSLVRASVCLRGSSFFQTTALPVEIKHTMIYMTELLQSLQYVKELELGEGFLKSLSMLVPRGLKNIPTSTRNCLILTLGEKVSIPGILYILKSSPYLETLTIKGHCSYLFTESEDVRKYLENTDLVFDHLKTINITLGEGEPMILVEFFLKNANVLQKMIVSYKSKYETEELSMALLAFPRASPEAKVVLDLKV